MRHIFIAVLTYAFCSSSFAASCTFNLTRNIPGGMDDEEAQNICRTYNAREIQCGLSVAELVPGGLLAFSFADALKACRNSPTKVACALAVAALQAPVGTPFEQILAGCP